MPRGERAHPRFHDIVVEPHPGWIGGMKVVVTADGPLGSFVSYMMSLGPMPSSAQARIAGAVGRLYDFWLAAPPATPVDESQFMDRFAVAVIHGTIHDGDDALGLFWPRSSKKKARQVLRIVTEFTDFCAQASNSVPLNPTREVRFIERIRSYQAQAHRKKYDLLAHLQTNDQKHARAAMARRVTLPRDNRVVLARPPFFPFHRTLNLIYEGFRLSQSGPYWKQYNVRDMMMVILQRFGGLRASEPLHLFVQDVAPILVEGKADGQMTARVRLFHPIEGATEYIEPGSRPPRRRRGSREEFLRVVFDRPPRNSSKWTSSAWVGWKDLLLEDSKNKCAFVHFFPEEWGVTFYQLYTIYISHVRPAKLDHPYLFVSGSKGDYAPLTRDAYTESLARAVRRIGLESRREDGTTSHGLRHAYGQMLEQLEMSKEFIQIMMHHKSVLSQEPYTKKTAQHLQAALDKARRQIATNTTGPGQISAANCLPPSESLTPWPR